MQHTGNRHENAIAEYHREAVERVADANIPRLVVVIELEHVVTVGGNVVGGAAECHQEKEEHRALKPERGVERERHAGKRRAEQRLHRQHPPPFRLVQIHEGAPERLDDPRQSEPARVKANLAVAHSQLHVHHHSHRHYDDVWQPLGDVKCGNPRPRVSSTPVFFLIQKTFVHHFVIPFVFLPYPQNCLASAVSPLYLGILIVMQQYFLVVVATLAHHGSSNLAEADAVSPPFPVQCERVAAFLHFEV